jgi:hypothetical protein
MPTASIRKSCGPTQRPGALGCLVGLSGLLVFYCGCNAAGAPAETGGAGDPDVRPQVLHEECNISASSSERLDANGDGRADVTIVREQGREVCRAADINFDGVVDAWSYTDPQGRVRRREFDFDRDGQIDEVAIYAAGAIVRKQRATTTPGKVDTWEHYSNEVLVRAERDSDGDGKVDQWWEYQKPGCPLMHADLNRDGRPDPGTTIDYCKETGYVPPQRQSYRKHEGPNFERTQAVPTETNVSQPEAAPGQEAGEP